MPKHQLADTLYKIFKDEKQRIVFWYDAELEFEEGLPDLNLDGVKTIRLDEVGSLEIKILLELQDTTGRYLLYAPFAEPDVKDDWLLDIRLYSRTFCADQASILVNELGLRSQALRPYIASRGTFFRSQDRLVRLQKWVKPEDGEQELNLKMLAVLCKADLPDIFHILMKLFGELSKPGGQQLLLTSQNSWDEIAKYDLAGAFWQSIAATFGYQEPEPTINDLLIRILVTDFAKTAKGPIPISLQHFVLASSTLSLTASVFANHWRSNLNHFANYNELSKRVAKQLKLDGHLGDLDEQPLLEVMTFEAVERRIILSLLAKMKDCHSFGSQITSVIAHRLDGYWTKDRFSSADINYRVLYGALWAAADLFELRSKFHTGLTYPNAAAIYAAYTGELYLFDQLYRQFHEKADQIELAGTDILKGLREDVENCYSNWFIDQIAISWGPIMEPPSGSGLLQEWRIPGISNQQDFFRTSVEPALKAYPAGRVYVIISDALRYEVAAELAAELNAKSRIEAEISSQLGILPSYTSLGMAALLPHKTLEFKANGDVEVDGLPTSSLEQRSKVLSDISGVAVKAEELLAMSKEKGREFVKPYRVIYIYHNLIDAVGDSASTESNTFSAARTTINEITALSGYIINNLNGSVVLITADHGFLFQETSPGLQDKSGLETKPEGTVKAKKRYLLGTNLGDNPKVWHGSTDITAGTKKSLEFWIPKGANRFHFAGGARYVHGGAMLQEVVVPIVTVKGLRVVEKTAKVNLSLLGTVKKVVNNMQRFEFIQTEAVSEKVRPITVSVSLRDDSDHLVSNEVTMTFDSTSDQMNDRKKSASLIVKSGTYDKKKEYYLVMRDVSDKTEVDRIPLTIDLSFGNEF
jgi:uncharacterized protein (TIGR02687 family)